LTRRQLQILQLRCQGKTLAEIAAAIDREERTVKDHMGHIYEKLGLDHLRGTARDLELAEYCRALHGVPLEDLSRAVEQEPEPEPASQRALVAVMEDELPLVRSQPSDVNVWVPRVPAPEIEAPRPRRLRGLVLAVAIAAGGGVVGAVLAVTLLRPPAEVIREIVRENPSPTAIQVQVTNAVTTNPASLVTRSPEPVQRTTGVAAAPGATASAQAARTPTTFPATPWPTHTPGPPPPPGTLLYLADWGDATKLWAPAPGWSVVEGILVFNPRATNARPAIFAPFEPTTILNYVVEAEIQAVEPGCPHFGIIVRTEYIAGIASRGCAPAAVLGTTGSGSGVHGDLGSKAFRPELEWRTYRAEVFGNTLKLSIDGTLMLDAPDNRYLSGGKVGILATTQVGVRSFKVVAL
jgi:hypothetical protein